MFQEQIYDAELYKIYKRKQDNNNSTKKAIMKTRKQELYQESDQENKKTRTRPRKQPRKKKNFFS